ncbi:hypothetical protein [Actinoplanes rectilineatus]|uniref:hypothetical protein n=1 Tax=Actinoplanes rectilineatus TaxID=113571 RepID=UPI001FE1C789|nr:hypothetical protein [Actinoplanes rectilineatus]
MTPDDDHSQQRRPLFFPVVIATVLLTIIGMIGGYLLSQHRNSRNVANTADSDYVVVDGDPCPEQTQSVGAEQGGTGVLREVLHVTTAKRTEIWICEDEAGRFFYHANKGGAGAPWVEGKTALFLDDVQPVGSGYVARAWDGNLFTVDSQRLLISYTDGRQEEQRVVVS